MIDVENVVVVFVPSKISQDSEFCALKQIRAENNNYFFVHNKVLPWLPDSIESASEWASRSTLSRAESSTNEHAVSLAIWNVKYEADLETWSYLSVVWSSAKNMHFSIDQRVFSGICIVVSRRTEFRCNFWRAISACQIARAQIVQNDENRNVALKK